MEKLIKVRSPRLYLVVLLSFLFISMQAQKTVRGTVTDSNGGTLIGVVVAIKGTNQAVTTDLDGRYQIAVSNDNTVLETSYIGYHPQTEKVGSKTVINFTLKEDDQLLEEVVVVGYGSQKKSSLTSAVSAIKGDELLKTPSTNVSSLLGGRLPGLSSVQETGEPGLDQATLRVRGSVYGVKYIVDGMPRSINDIDPNDIESISVLKDGAAAAVFGLEAAGGVVIITTKQGSLGKPEINFSNSYGISVNANFPKFMNAPQFAHYYNMADMMDKLASGAITDASQYSAIFTNDNIAKMTNGDPTDGWDNVNYIDEVFGTGINQRYNLSLQGGTENIKYFSSIGYLNQKGNIEGFDFRRYNLRSNLTADINKNLRLTFGISGDVGRRKTPGYSSGGSDGSSVDSESGWLSISRQTIAMHPYLPKTYDGLYTATPLRNTGLPQSPLAAIHESGYKKTRSTGVQTNITLEYRLPWIEGLSLKATGAYDYSTSHNKNLDTPYTVSAIKLPDSTQKLDYTTAQDPRGKSTISLGEGQVTWEQLVGQAGIYYANKFAKNDIDLMFLGEIKDYKTNSFSAYAKDLNFAELPELGLGKPANNPIAGKSSNTRSIGYVFRARYNYDEKYLGEVTGRYDGSYLFAGMANKRWALFPSASLAWRISKENFMSNLTFIDELKLRTSVGLLGNAGVSPFAFLSIYNYNPDRPLVKLNDVLQSALFPDVIANLDLTWEKTLSYNVGYDFSMWGGKLGMEFDFFYKYIYDMITAMSGNYSPSMGGYFPTYANYNRMDTRGFEILLTHQNTVKAGGHSLFYKIAPNLTYATSRWLRYPQAANVPSNQKIVGSKPGSLSGWIAEGLYRSEEEIDNSAWYGSRPNVGDIKYRDINGDGKIDNQDRGIIGRSNRPELTFGLNLAASWNNFDINALFSGGALFDVSLTGTYYNGYDDNTVWTQSFKEGSNSPLYLVQNAYSIANQNGEYPRLTLGSPGHGGDNGLASTFWLRDGKYVRLKSLQIGYTIPTKVLRPLGLKTLRVFTEGSNIFTISGLPDGIDPESPGVNNGYYPQQKTFMGGINLSF